MTQALIKKILPAKEDCGVINCGDCRGFNRLHDLATQSLNKAFADGLICEVPSREELLGAVARGWCSDDNKHKVMDSTLAVAIAQSIHELLRKNI